MCRHVLTLRTAFLVTLNCERKTVLTCTTAACVLKVCITLSIMIRKLLVNCSCSARFRCRDMTISYFWWQTVLKVRRTALHLHVSPRFYFKLIYFYMIFTNCLWCIYFEPVFTSTLVFSSLKRKEFSVLLNKVPVIN